MTTPKLHVRRWHQYRDDHGQGEPILGPAGTHQVRDDRILTWVDETSFLNSEHFPVLTEAAEHTRLRQITLIGPSPETKRVANALSAYWDTVFPREPPKPKAIAAPTRTGRGRCGQPKTDGSPCGLIAGWGADPGEQHCVHHGGSTLLQDAARQHLDWQLDTLARMSRKSATGQPFTVRERLDGLVALRDTMVEIEDRRRRGRPV